MRLYILAENDTGNGAWTGLDAGWDVIIPEDKLEETIESLALEFGEDFHYILYELTKVREG